MSRLSTFVLCTVAVVGIAAWASNSAAYETYHDPALKGMGNCSSCHPGFTGGPGDTLHSLHTGGGDPVTKNCNLCHSGAGRNNPFIMWSVEGLGCAGCHARDYGETIQLPDGYDNGSGVFDLNGLPKSSGYGLRKHHLNSGIGVCLGCHSDVSESFIELESVNPVYYARSDVSLGGMSVDACLNEDTANDSGLLGLDNDGDFLYDLGDPDCSVPECASDADCDDGVFCNGAEICDIDGVCQPGPDPCLPGDVCDEIDDVCLAPECASDADCDEGVFCNGAEICDIDGVCQPGPAPCLPGDVCDEINDVCLAPECAVDADCDDGVFCNGGEICDVDGVCQPGSAPCLPGDVCDETNDVCLTPECAADADCDDGIFCNGAEICDVDGFCQPGPAPCLPGDVCDETNDVCLTPECAADADCDDGIFCNGAEICDVDGFCQPGSAPCLPGDVCDETNDVCLTPECAGDADCDDGIFCNGAEICDINGFCQPGPAPCLPGDVCDETNDVCLAPECAGDADCDDGVFCNGAEICDINGFCQPGPAPCLPGDVCDEINDVCLAPECAVDADCDDGVFCNGAEICDINGFCQSGPDPCLPGDVCDETNDVCLAPECDAGADCHCPPAPLAGCSTAGKSQLQIRDKYANGPGRKDRVSWKWLKGPAHVQGDFGSPLTTTTTAFCVYADGGASLAFEASVPPGGTCGGKPCWKAIGTKGYRYKDKLKSAGGTLKLDLKGGDPGKSKVSVYGKDGNLPLPSLPLNSSGDVIVQLSNDANANCWEATFAPGDVSKDTAEWFKAKTR